MSRESIKDCTCAVAAEASSVEALHSLVETMQSRGSSRDAVIGSEDCFAPK